MAALGSLVVSLEARIAQFTQDMAQASRQTQQAMSQMTAAGQQTQRAMDAVSKSTDQARAAFIGLASALSVAKLIEYSDSWTAIESKIRLTTNSSSDLVKVENQLFEISQRQHSLLAPTVTLYSRLSQSSKNLGASQSDLMKFTEAVSASLRLSSASTGESASTILQLSQALGNVNVQGQEFNAIADAAPGLLITAAQNIQELGGDVSKLRALMLDGKLSSKLFFDAIMQGADGTIEKASKMSLTIGQSFTGLNNELVRFVGEGSKTSGAGKAIAESVQLLSTNLNTTASAVSGLIVYKVAEWAALSVVGLKAKAIAAAESAAADKISALAMREAAAAAAIKNAANLSVARAELVFAEAAVASTAALVTETRALILAAGAGERLALTTNVLAPAHIKATAAVEAHALALANLAAAEAAAATGGKLAAGALALVGGPIGAITLALGAGVTAWMLWKDSAKNAADGAAKSVYSTTQEIIADLDRQNAARQKTIDLAKTPISGPLSTTGGPRDTEQAAKKRELEAQNRMLKENAGISKSMSLNDRTALIIKNAAAIAEIDKKTAVGVGQIAEIAKLEGQKKLADWLAQNGTNAQKLAAELKAVKNELGSGFTPEVEARIRKKYEEKPDKSVAAAIKEEDRTVKNKLAGELKEIEANLASSQSSYQFNNQFMAELRSQDLISEGQYNVYRKSALETNLGNIRDSFEQQIALETKFRATLKKGSEKEASQNRIDALNEKARLAAQEAQQQNAMLNLGIQGDGKSALSKLKFNAVDKNDPESIAAKKTRDTEKDYLANVKIIESQRKDTTESLAAYHTLVEQNEADHNARLRLIHQETADAKAKTDIESLAMAGNVTSQLYSLLKQSGKEGNALAKAAFIANKAIAVAEIIMNTNVAASKVKAQTGLFGIPMATIILTTGYAQAGMVAGMAIAEASARNGFDVPAGSEPITQLHEKEMVLPAAQADVIRGLAKDGGSGDDGPLTIINQTTGRVDSVEKVQLSNGDRALIIKEAVQATANEMSNPNSKSHKAVKNAFSVQTMRS